jgi:hypothetical protein
MFSIDIITVSNMYTTILLASNAIAITLYLTSNYRIKNLNKKLKTTELNIIDLKKKVKILKLGAKDLLKYNNKLQITIEKCNEDKKDMNIEFEAILWGKDGEIKKLKNLLELNKDENTERKTELIKLRCQIKKYQQQIKLYQK